MTRSFLWRPVTVIETQRQLISVDAGNEKSITMDPKFLSKGTRTKVTVSSTAATDLVPALESLMDYPYGCVEQTSSRLRSLLAAGHVLSLRRADSIQPFVDAGISRLWSLQLRSGALSYWPGQSHAANWGTAYATENAAHGEGARARRRRAAAEEPAALSGNSSQQFGRDGLCDKGCDMLLPVAARQTTNRLDVRPERRAGGT